VVVQALMIAGAGAVGALLRWRLGVIIPARTFPWATLGINLSGTFVLALLLAGPLATRLSATTVTAVAVGLLGSYTTFSTFGYETFTLIRTERIFTAIVYSSLSLVGGVAVAALGYVIGRQLSS
jgi:CrcB protein